MDLYYVETPKHVSENTEPSFPPAEGRLPVSLPVSSQLDSQSSQAATSRAGSCVTGCDIGPELQAESFTVGATAASERAAAMPTMDQACHDAARASMLHSGNVDPAGTDESGAPGKVSLVMAGLILE